MLPRMVQQQVADALTDTPVVYVQGPRQAGKSTLVRGLCEATGRPYLTLDDATTLAAASADPIGFVRGLPPAVALDEVQRAPALPLALKAEVDADRRPGRFLLTGSAGIGVLPKLAEALVGRMEIVTLWPMAQAEIDRLPGRFAEVAFEASLPEVRGLDRAEIAGRAARGGYPEAYVRSPERRARWYESYLVTLLQRDVRDLANIADLAAMPRLLALIGARSAALANLSEIAGALGMPQTTVKRYLALLEGTFLVGTVPAWASNRGQRLIKAPKLVLHDSGLLAHLTGGDPAFGGRLLESFAIGEIARSAGRASARPRLLHFRTATAREVDVVLEDRAGNVVGVEVKSAASVDVRDLAGLRALAEAARDRFVRGIVLYTGDRVIPLGDRLHAVPFPALWAW
jgi:uncharacterized protein